MNLVDGSVEFRATPIADRLPEELILDCLRSTDFLSRVHASHVSRAWRAAIIAGPHLWNAFSCRRFRDAAHQDAAFDQLETVLQRSHPLPFLLRIPHRYLGDDSEYADRLVAIPHLDVRRLELYDGPLHVLDRLNAKRLPLPRLTSLICLDAADEDASNKFCGLSSHCSPQCLPNLRSLRGPDLSFRDHSPFSAVTSLTCYLGERNDCPPTFRLFPNLLHLDLTASWAEYAVGTPLEVNLPAGPLPPSLESVVLRCDPSEDSCEFYHPLSAWSGERIPRLRLEGASSVQGLMAIFLASHEHPAKVLLTSKRQEVILVAGPDNEYTWTIEVTGYEDEFIRSLKSLWSSRLTSMSIAIEQLRNFLLARMTAPAVLELQLRLCGSFDSHAAGVPLFNLNPALLSFIAPRLQRLILRVDGDEEDVRRHMADTQAALALLKRSFRSLIVYDATLLDSISLLCPEDVEHELDCGEWAWFATEFLVNPED
ncbi:hypothetical protein AURDEDRAFT_148774 [Auricularia subglabra TFB-10046 SS5]|nr:hypothetical protein AURDEDRAFT_148774 [Auricularia subglabra TFB-10046 SS5]